MSVLMEQRETLGYLPIHLLGIINIKFPPPGPLPGTLAVLPYVIMGDEAFKLTITLMRLYPHDQAKADTDKAPQLPTLCC